MGYIILNQPKKRKKRRRRGRNADDDEYQVHEYSSKKQKKLYLFLGALFLLLGVVVCGLLMFFYKKGEISNKPSISDKKKINLKTPCIFFSMLEFKIRENFYDYDIIRILPKVRNFSAILEAYYSQGFNAKSSYSKYHNIIASSNPTKLIGLVPDVKKEALLEAALYKIKFDDVFFDTLSNDLEKYLARVDNNKDEIDPFDSTSLKNKNTETNNPQDENGISPMSHQQFFSIKIFRKNYMGKFLLFKLSFKSVVNKFQTEESNNSKALGDFLGQISLDAQGVYDKIFSFLYSLEGLDNKSIALEKIDFNTAQIIMSNLNLHWKQLRDYEIMYILILLFYVDREDDDYKVTSDYNIETEFLQELENVLTQLILENKKTPIMDADEDKLSYLSSSNENKFNKIRRLFNLIFKDKLREIDLSKLEKK